MLIEATDDYSFICTINQLLCVFRCTNDAPRILSTEYFARKFKFLFYSETKTGSHELAIKQPLLCLSCLYHVGICINMIKGYIQ